MFVVDDVSGGVIGVGMGYFVVMDDNVVEFVLSYYLIELWCVLSGEMFDGCVYCNCGMLWFVVDVYEMDLVCVK